MEIDTGHNGNQQFAAGERVTIAADGDGALGAGGLIKRVFRSGRCLVYLDNGDMRNILPGNLTHAVSDR